MAALNGPDQITSVKQARTLTLVPNRRAYELHLARAFLSAREPRVLIAPALDVLSQWVEQTSARIDLLQGRPVAGSADPLLLDLLWQQAISSGPQWSGAFENLSLARYARAAERLMRQWSPPGANPWQSADFRGWRAAVMAALRDRHLYTPEDWRDHLQAQLDQPGELPLSLPAAIELNGFVEFTWQEQSLLDTLQRRGVEIVVANGPKIRTATHRQVPATTAAARAVVSGQMLHAFDSANEEIRATAHWAMKNLQPGNRRIAVVVNGLDALAGRLMPVFDRIIHPHDAMRVAVSGDSLYHLPDGSRLSDHSSIADALLFLRLLTQEPALPHPFPDISRLLLSPHLAGWPDEHPARARFELLLRGEGRYFHSLQSLKSQLERCKLGSALPVLCGLLDRAGTDTGGPDAGQAFLRRLLQWGWPGAMPRGTLLSRRVQQFIGLLERLRQSRTTDRGGPLSPIQLLDPEDVVGQSFDAAWVMNVHDGNWPGHPVTNPLLPAVMFKHVPRATPEGALEFSRRVQSSLEVLAPEMHYSWSRTGDEVPRLASPLLASIPDGGAGARPAPQWSAFFPAAGDGLKCPTGYAGHPWLRVLDDVQGLPLRRGDDIPVPVPGGSAMVRDQSACPMMAYLSHRLRLRFEPMPGPFADNAYRGKLLHQALYRLYQDQQGRPGLPKCEGISAAVDGAMQALHARYRLAPPAFSAERQRLNRLLQQWLEFENQRRGFMVAELERAHRVEVQGLILDIRLDRVDRLADGRKFIIDYKSGAIDATGWTRERLAQAQLPLYAVLLDLQQANSVAGLALASVRTGACGMKGIVDDPLAAWMELYGTDNRRCAFGQKFDGWNSLFSHWKTGVSSLLGEIAEGEAANRLYDEKGLQFAGLDTVLRRSEGEAWLVAHDAPCIGGRADQE